MNTSLQVVGFTSRERAMVNMPRPDYRTLSRHPSLAGPTTAYAKVGGMCPCGDEVEPGDPIFLTHTYITVSEDGTKSVDLTAAEWNCQGPNHAGTVR
jgi:hypothetical protein